VLLKSPPRIKVLEAAGSIADHRVARVGDHFEVSSSMGDRLYHVYLDENFVSSDDNGTTFRHYVGYPVIAVMMVNEKLPLNKKISKKLQGIKWRELNEKFKNYHDVEVLIKQELKKKGVDEDEVDEFIEEVLLAVKDIKLASKA